MDSSTQPDDEKVFKGQDAQSPHQLHTPTSNTSLSPSEQPPQRVQSFSSLVGEDYINLGRTPENYMLGSYSDDDHTTPPSVCSGLQRLSPPPLRPPSDPFVTTSVSSVQSYPNQGAKKGRPPRAPVAFTSNSKTQTQPNHNRGHSTGELSFMSALTDPFNDDAKLRQRGNSWDANFYDVSPTGDHDVLLQADPPPSIFQPILTDEPPRSILTSPVRPINRAKDKLDVSDLINPMESEAETAIMKALEGRERNNTRPTTAAVLPNLTDEAVASFQDHYIKPEERRENGFIPSPLRSPANSPRAKEGHDREKGNSTLKNETSDEQEIANAKTSVHTILYNLAKTMRDIHTSTKSRSDNAELGYALPADDIGHPVAVNPVGKPRTQSDNLANNAALLFRGRIRPSERMPDTFASVITDSKKNDDADSPDENISDDVELGVGRSGSTGGKNSRCSMLSILCCKMRSRAKYDWETFDKFLDVPKRSCLTYTKHSVIHIVLPCAAVSAFLFYCTSNPSLTFGYNETTDSFPSVSWFILFLGVRQVITFNLAKLAEAFVIDYLALKTPSILYLFGKFWSLTIIQSKGWPSTLFFWALLDFLLLAGKNKFANHWLFFQRAIPLFNDTNPSGDITSNIWNFRILLAAVFIAFAVALKRIVMGLYLGGRQYVTYGSKLAAVIHDMIMVSEVASMSLQKVGDRRGRDAQNNRSNGRYPWPFIAFIHDEAQKEGNTIRSGTKTAPRDEYTCSLSKSEFFKLRNVLDEWEEPAEELEIDTVSLKGILQFKQTLAFMDLSYPFSTAFGLADTRENCLRSAKEVYGFLLQGNPESETLKFETLISRLEKDPITQERNETTLKALVRIFRPERDGTLDLVGFVRSVDRVYKDMRLLRASIRNSSQIDQAFEAIIAVGFYFVLFCIVLACWHIDPLALFLSVSSVIIAFSFAIGRSCANYIDGVLFILLRTPYDIGDRISINAADDAPSVGGVMTWYVEKVTLYYTTVRLGATNEVATIANSSLATARIVNAARSQKAIVYVNLKFGIDVPYSKLQLFKETVESFIKGRPREWLKCSAIRPTRVEADLGFIEYVVVLQHRESWQNINIILESKAAVTTFCMEVKKKLGMRYIAPPTPVDLTVTSPQALSSLLQGTQHGSTTTTAHVAAASDLNAFQQDSQQEPTL